MFIFYKEHTTVKESNEINNLLRKSKINYTMFYIYLN